MPTNDPPTAKQQRYLRSLAQKTGTSFTPLRTKAEATREINRLRDLKASPSYERRKDRQAVDEGFEHSGGASATREEEIDGWGSTATWR